MNWLCAVVAAVLFFIGGAIEVSDEVEFVGLSVTAFLMFGLFFLALSLVVPANVNWPWNRQPNG